MYILEKKLDLAFYQQHVAIVAKELLGKVLVFGDQQGIITETEAYRGADDEASHAYKGPTKRAGIMFDAPGVSYVYLIYGMYYCLNIVTEPEGQASAVLIRGLKILPNINLNGPGKICRHLGITLEHNNIDLINSKNFYLFDAGFTPAKYEVSSRIGIKKATDKQWRFFIL